MTYHLTKTKNFPYLIYPPKNEKCPGMNATYLPIFGKKFKKKNSEHEREEYHKWKYSFSFN